MATKLCRVRTTKEEFKGYHDVEITWIAMDRKEPPVHYADAIEGLSADVEANGRQRDAVDELFTRDEAEAWAGYLRKHYDDKSVEIVEQLLPLGADIRGLSYPQGGPNLLRPVRENDYPFRFEVYGYYDLPQHGGEEEMTEG
jgi:hypothetical protein